MLLIFVISKKNRQRLRRTRTVFKEKNIQKERQILTGSSEHNIVTNSNVLSERPPETIYSHQFVEIYNSYKIFTLAWEHPTQSYSVRIFITNTSRCTFEVFELPKPKTCFQKVDKLRYFPKLFPMLTTEKT